jgi:cold shock CspA family protein/ribosome-associated translation inhibitor RaiA
MDLPLELTFRGVEKTESLETLIREKVDKLEKICDYINGCRIVVEKPQAHQDRGNPYRVRIDVTVPPGHELVAERGPMEGSVLEQLPHVIRETFDAMERQLKELVEKQRGEEKRHPEQMVVALVSKLYPEEDHGFLQTVDGREVYFHRNAVVNDEFDDLEVGMGVNYTEEQGQEGPQASSVRVVSRPSAG